MAAPSAVDQVTNDPAKAPEPSRRRRLAAAAAVAVGFLAVVLGLLALPGGNVVGDTTTNVAMTTVTPELEKGSPIVQPFVASEDRLAAVYVTFGTFYGEAQCDLRVTLLERAPGGDVGDGSQVATHDWSCDEVADSGRFRVLQFDPLEESAGRTYDVVIERVDDGDGRGAVVWAGEPKGDALPVVIDGEVDPDLSTMVRGEYDPQPHRWDHLDRTMDRLAAYGPSWGTPLVFGFLVLALGALLAAGPIAVRSTKAVLVLVGALALVRGLVWSAALPAFEAMDEPAHFAYVQFLAEEREFPGHVDNHEIFSERLHGAIDVLNVDSTTPGDRPDYTEGADERAAEEVAQLDPSGGGGGPGTMYAPFYYLGAVPLYLAGGDDIFTQLALARLWSVLLGVGAALLLVRLGRQLFPDSSGAQMAFVLAGVLQPMIAHQFAIVNNDAWVILAGFAALSVGLDLTRRGRAPGLALLAGAIIGAGLLGKPFGIAVAVPLAVGWLVGKVRARQRSWRVLLGEAGLVVAGFAATFGMWSLNAARLNLRTSEVPDKTATGQTVREFLHAHFGDRAMPARRIWGDQLWGDFGWVRIPLPEPIPTVLVVVEVLLLLGLAVWLVVVLREWRRARRLRAAAVAAVARTATVETTSAVAKAEGGDADAAAEPTGERRRETDEAALRDAPIPLDVRILVVGATILGIIATLYAAGWLYYMSTGANDLVQGRYALLAVPAFLAGPALVAERLSRGRVRPFAVNVLAAFGMAAANLLGIFVVLEAFYG